MHSFPVPLLLLSICCCVCNIRRKNIIWGAWGRRTKLYVLIRFSLRLFAYEKTKSEIGILLLADFMKNPKRQYAPLRKMVWPENSLHVSSTKALTSLQVPPPWPMAPPPLICDVYAGSLYHFFRRALNLAPHSLCFIQSSSSCRPRHLGLFHCITVLICPEDDCYINWIGKFQHLMDHCAWHDNHAVQKCVADNLSWKQTSETVRHSWII